MAGIAISNIFRRATKSIRHTLLETSGNDEIEINDNASMSTVEGESGISLDDKVETNLKKK
jgi:hypothetical protein